MTGKFDIFRRLPDGHPIWVMAVDGLDEAKRQLEEIVTISPGEYFIFDSRLGRVVRSYTV